MQAKERNSEKLQPSSQCISLAFPSKALGARLLKFVVCNLSQNV